MKTLKTFNEIATIIAIVAFFFLGYDYLKGYSDNATMVYLTAFVSATALAFVSGLALPDNKRADK